MATPVTVSMETMSSQNSDQPTIAVPPTTQQPPPAIPTMIAAASPPSQPAVALPTIPGAVPITPPITTIAAAPPPSAAVGGSLSSVLGPPVPEIKVKEEVEPMDIMRPVSGKFICRILFAGNCFFPFSYSPQESKLLYDPQSGSLTPRFPFEISISLVFNK